MTIFKCKICGGSLEIDSTQSVATCEYCGTKQTLPKLDNERRANLYDRANHFRRNNDFDKAMGIYENILNEDNTDAEAYWSLVLCRYGIEYVEDPASHKRIPTVNRAQFTSIFDDEDYKSAIANADGYQREIYEEEATAINEIQKGILAISQKEEPFDIFVCYKETDGSGRRTQDSVLATELYHELTREGFKVFFSRITLEDKLGVAYEPYIFAALHSAKVMVVLGTRPEHFNAVWVKNEWSRYLSLIKNGAKKTLIPAYRDMDPYDLPEEFSHLQAQDMSKLGFMQDLTRGIKKIVDADAPKATVKETIVATAATINVAPLLKRAFMFLEDGDWERADDFCEQVLNQDPECSEAYLGKLMAELHVKKQDRLVDQAEPFDHNNNYQKAVRFADDKLKAALAGYIEHINTRNENARLEGIYSKATVALANATSSTEYENASNIFKTILNYKDSQTLFTKCLENAEKARIEEKEKAEISRKERIYNGAITLMNKPAGIMNKFSTTHYEEAIKEFQKISGWRDSDEKIIVCQKKIEELKVQAEAERLEKERKAEIARKEAKKRAKRNKIISIITTSIVCAIFAFIIILNTVIIPNNKYNDAVALMDAGKYTEAISAFEALEGYKDSATKINECNTAILDGKYNDAIALMEAGKYTDAISAFEALEGYKDSATKINECNTAILDGKYNDAIALMEAGKYTDAISAFEALDGYKDSVNKIEECNVNIYGEEVWNKVKSVNVGDVYKFGSYEQDNNKSNGQEDIEWLVLEKDGTKILVVSKYALDSKPYNTSYTDVTWETCTLRKWLNNDFLGSAFSANEKAMIPTVTVSADKNPDYNTNPGNAMQDQVFLLSITEANKYFSSDSARQCKPTDYAVANGAWESDSGNCVWWLRSPGDDQNIAACVDNRGDVREDGNFVSDDDVAVRPALWIDLYS